MTRRANGPRRYTWRYAATHHCITCGDDYIAFHPVGRRCGPCAKAMIRVQNRLVQRRRRLDPAAQAAAHNALRKNRGQQWAAPTILGTFKGRRKLESQVCACGAVALRLIRGKFYCKACKP